MADSISLPEPVEGLTVVPATGSWIANPDFAPEFCTSLMSRRIHARCINLLAPALLSTPPCNERYAEQVLVKQFKLIHSSNIILFGVGDIGPETLIRSANITGNIDAYQAGGAVGVLICRFIDAEGRPVRGDLDNRMVGIELNELSQVPRRLRCGGASKLTAIRATLKGCATHLVTDIATAEMLLQ
ncbi:sugar-binding domain-containing protein [Ensifer canadensis]